MTGITVLAAFALLSLAIRGQMGTSQMASSHLDQRFESGVTYFHPKFPRMFHSISIKLREIHSLRKFLRRGRRQGVLTRPIAGITPRNAQSSSTSGKYNMFGEMEEKFENWGTCEMHPGKFPQLQPVLLKRWNHIPVDGQCSFAPSLIYLPRCSALNYTFEDDRGSILTSFDLFYAPVPDVNNAEAVTFYFHRPARIYLLIPNESNSTPSADSIPGFQNSGSVVSGTQDSFVEYGITKTEILPLPSRAHVFYKTAPHGSATVPDLLWLQNNAVGLQNISSFTILFSEFDGLPSSKPQSPAGVPAITSGERCPQELHDLWKIPGVDKEDADIAGLQFSTWHPMWDPCYWCGYDHEHGSNGGGIMGVPPTYNYPSLKNMNQPEFRNGFKSFVFRQGAYIISYDLHASTFEVVRVFTRFHSGMLTVVKADTLEVMAQITMKLDFGAAKVRVAGQDEPQNIFPSENSVDEELQGKTPRSRLFNIMFSLNYDELDRNFTYLSEEKFTRGQYEQWRTAFICSSESSDAMLKVDFRDPGTALKTQSSGPEDEPTTLGVFDKSMNFNPNLSLNRRLNIHNMRVAFDLCSKEAQEIARNGIWYTDPQGNNAYSNPGKYRIRQYMKPGFSIELDGVYAACSDGNDELYVEGAKGGFVDKQHTIDYRQN